MTGMNTLHARAGLTALLLTSLASAAVLPLPSAITRENFEQSPMCARYHCTLRSASAEHGSSFYTYTVLDENGTKIRVGIARTPEAKNIFDIYGAPGSLASMPSVVMMKFFIMTTQYYTGVRLDIKDDLLGTGSLVGPDQVEFFDIASGKIGRVPVKIFEKSLPDDSMNPDRAQLMYGIIDSAAYPPFR